VPEICGRSQTVPETSARAQASGARDRARVSRASSARDVRVSDMRYQRHVCAGKRYQNRAGVRQTVPETCVCRQVVSDVCVRANGARDVCAGIAGRQCQRPCGCQTSGARETRARV
jgi:hypothetical protein